MTGKIKLSKPVTVTVAFILIVLIIGCAIWFFTTGDDSVSTMAEPADKEREIEQTKEESFRYTEPELREIIEKVAKDRFGDDAFIIFLSSEGPEVVEIHGVKRNIYIYAADSRSAHDETGEIRGLYHVDADTGEIFDNGNGNMEQVTTGE